MINLSDLSDSYDGPYCTCNLSATIGLDSGLDEVQSLGYIPTSPVYEPTSPGYMPTSPRLGTPPLSPAPPSSPLKLRRPAHVVFALAAIPRRTGTKRRRRWGARQHWTSTEATDYYSSASRRSARS